MLDIKRIKSNLEKIKKDMENRGQKDIDLDRVVSLDDKRRELLKSVEQMKNEQNITSKQIPKLKKEGKDDSELMLRLKELSNEIKQLDENIKNVEQELQYNLLRIPNIPNENTPKGNSDADNKEIRSWGEPKIFDFELKAHWDIGTDLEILDFETASKITGSRFTLYKDLGARLERSLINFYLDNHTKHGYTEVMPPFIANRA